MCAMIPMLRTRSRGYSRADVGFPAFVSIVITTCTPYRRGSLRSPLVVGERLVGLGHLVRLLLAANGGTGVVHRVHQLAGELLGHRLARALARGLDEPAHRERATAGRRDLYGHLVGRAADAAGLDLEERRRVLHRGLEDLDRRLPRRLLGALHGVVDDALRRRTLAVAHHLVDELLDGHVRVLAVSDLGAVGGTSPAWHLLGRPLLRLRVLRAVERTTLHAILHARGVERAADDVVLDRRKVRHPAAADQDDGVLLQVVADARDVRRDLHVIGEADAGDLPERRVRLLRGHRADDRADATLLGRALTELHEAAVERVPRRAQRGRVHLRLLALPALADQLRDRRHAATSPSRA